MIWAELPPLIPSRPVVDQAVAVVVDHVVTLGSVPQVLVQCRRRRVRGPVNAATGVSQLGMSRDEVSRLTGRGGCRHSPGPGSGGGQCVTRALDHVAKRQHVSSAGGRAGTVAGERQSGEIDRIRYAVARILPKRRVDEEDVRHLGLDVVESGDHLGALERVALGVRRATGQDSGRQHQEPAVLMVGSARGRPRRGIRARSWGWAGSA